MRLPSSGDGIKAMTDTTALANSWQEAFGNVNAGIEAANARRRLLAATTVDVTAFNKLIAAAARITAESNAAIQVRGWCGVAFS